MKTYEKGVERDWQTVYHAISTMNAENVGRRLHELDIHVYVVADCSTTEDGQLAVWLKVEINGRTADAVGTGIDFDSAVRKAILNGLTKIWPRQ